MVLDSGLPVLECVHIHQRERSTVACTRIQGDEMIPLGYKWPTFECRGMPHEYGPIGIERLHSYGYLIADGWMEIRIGREHIVPIPGQCLPAPQCAKKRPIPFLAFDEIGNAKSLRYPSMDDDIPLFYPYEREASKPLSDGEALGMRYMAAIDHVLHRPVATKIPQPLLIALSREEPILEHQVMVADHSPQIPLVHQESQRLHSLLSPIAEIANAIESVGCRVICSLLQDGDEPIIAAVDVAEDEIPSHSSYYIADTLIAIEPFARIIKQPNAWCDTQVA